MLKKVSLRLLFCLLLCGPSVRVEAAGLTGVLPGYFNQPNLESANGNKIVVGKFNHLHAVMTSWDPSFLNSDVYYTEMVYDSSPSATDPYVWSYDQISFDTYSSQPAVASGSDGQPVVVWVSKACATNPLGAIYYSRRTSSGWSTPRQIVALGAEPAIAIEGTTVHLAWTTGDRVEYASFPTSAPPSMPLWMGEVADVSNCPGTRFHQPSIAFVYPPCGTLSVRIAALLTSNEQANPGICHAAATQAGPKVYERDVNTQAWSTVYQDLTSDPAANQPDPVAVSMSMNANRVTGDFYLAWSYEQNQTSYTKAGHGNGANWDVPQVIDPQSRHVHVAAKTGGGAGQFRLALSDTGWSTNAYTQTGKWSGGLTWTGPIVNLPDFANNYPLVGHPQALYWRRCASNTLREMTAYTEASYWNPSINNPDVAIDPTTTNPVSCYLVADVLPMPHCFTQLISLAQVVHAGGGNEVLVDLGDTAVVTKVSETGAEITTVAGGTIQATWLPGEVLYTWENGFAINTRRDSLRFTSKDTEFRIEDSGVLGNQTGAR